MDSYGQFLMVMLRVTGIFILAPVFSSNIIPFRLKGALVLLISLVSFPILAGKNLLANPQNFVHLVTMGAGELFIGFTIGFMVLIVITIFQVSGQFYSIQMGFGIINVFDPLAESSVPIISQLKTLLMTLLFLVLDGHHMLLEAVFRSYEYLPTAHYIKIEPLMWEMASQFDRIFYLGFLIGTPLIGIVFLMTTTLGILSKLAPQMNVMVMGFGLKVMVGIFTFVTLLPSFMKVATSLYKDIFRELYLIMQVMA